LALVHSIRGTGNLDPVQLGVMGALFLWRDAKAREFDRPCGSVISNERLVKIARALDPNVARRYTHTHTHTHTTRPAFNSRDRRVRRYGRNYAEELVACLDEALLRPPQVPPRPTSNVRTVRRKCLEPQPPPNQEGEGEEEDGGEEAEEEDEEEEAPPAPPEQQGR
jgi:ribonuclease D